MLGYATVVYSTVLLSVSYIPGVHSFLQHAMPHSQARPLFVISGNIIFIVLLIVTQAGIRRNRHAS